MHKDLKLLYTDTKEIHMTDIFQCLQESGYHVIRYCLDYSAEKYCEEAAQELRTVIAVNRVDLVISYDFVPNIAEACYAEEVPYIAWVYDAPQKELYAQEAFFPGNYIFMFDKKQCDRLRGAGVPNVYHMPLAVKRENYKAFREKSPIENETWEVSFIGQLYWDKQNEALINQMEVVKQELEQVINKCCMVWNKETTIHGTLSEECAELLRKYESITMGDRYPYVSDRYLYETALWARTIAHRERVNILNTLAEKYEVRFYTKDKDISELSKKVKICPGVPYGKLPELYHNSKINLNITLHCIESGVPQRVFDIMAAGGFVLSNYQEELEELFVPGKEIVLFHNMQELEELVEYYLTHEEERKAIALAGQRKVLEKYDYHDKLDTAIKLVMQQEKDREQSYSEIYNKWLRVTKSTKRRKKYGHKLPLQSIAELHEYAKQNMNFIQERYEMVKAEEQWSRIDMLLQMADDISIAELEQLMQSEWYKEAVSLYDSLAILEKMMVLYRTEKKTGVIPMLARFGSLEVMEYVYHKTVFYLRRIELSLPEEYCLELLDFMQECELSGMYLIIVLQYGKISDRKGTANRLANLLAQYGYTNEAMKIMAWLQTQ